MRKYKPQPPQREDVEYRACNKCGIKFELSEENFDKVEETVCNRGFRWHCRDCYKELVVL